MKQLKAMALLLCCSLTFMPLSVCAEETESEGTETIDVAETSETQDDAAADELTYEQRNSGSLNGRRENPYIPSTGKKAYSDAEIAKRLAQKYNELDSAYGISDPFRRTKTIDSIDSYILNFSEDLLKDQKITFIGDSITVGVGGTPTLDGTGMNYTDFIANYTDAEIVNLGIGGTPINGLKDDSAIVYRYGEIPQDSDIIVLFAGINDFLASEKDFGSLSHPDENTYCGDVYTVFRGIHTMYPKAQKYCVITYRNKAEDDMKFTGETWEEYFDIQLRMAEQFGFNVINLYEEGFMDSHDTRIRNAFFKDNLHPDDLGSEILGRHILVHLLRNQ